jgi:glutamate-1-semialdehyde 2,1-aminomutase
MSKDKSRSLFEQARRRIPGGVNSPVRAFKAVGGTPIYFDRAAGPHFWDADGRQYVDFCNSWGPLILGHGHPGVLDAVHTAVDKGLSYGACHGAEVEFASMVLEAFPEYDKVRAVSSGTEAVMTALRIARGFTGRDKIVKFVGGYHGHFDGLLVKAGSGLATFAIADSNGVPEDIAKTTLVGDLDSEQSVQELFDNHGDDIAAVVIEPLPANNGMLVQRPEFLQFLRDITTRHGALLIFDEVISGFRFKFGGYGQMVGIQPDLVTLGKIIGGGMPVGAITGPAGIMDVLSPVGSVYQAGTLSGNPVSLAAGIAMMKVLRDDNPYPALNRMGQLFVSELRKSKLPYAKAVQVGSVVWMYLDESKFPRAADTIGAGVTERFNGLYWKLLERGYYPPPSGLEVMFISTAHTEEHVAGLAAAVVEELEQL